MDQPAIVLLMMPPVWCSLPPLGPAYLMGQLNRFGYKVIYYDFNLRCYGEMDSGWRKRWTLMTQTEAIEFGEDFRRHYGDDLDRLIRELARQGTGYIGLTVFQQNEALSLYISRRIKAIAPGIRIIWGGPQIQYRLWQWSKSKSHPNIQPGDQKPEADPDPARTEKSGHGRVSGYDPSLAGPIPPEYRVVDDWVVGEGEWALLRILEGEKTGWHRIEVDSLDRMAFPDYSRFELKRYSRQRALPVLFSRGCINRCRFCAESRLYGAYQYHDPDGLVDYLLHLKQVYHLHWITFHDSMINGNLEALERLCRLMIRRKLDLHWDAQLGIRNDMESGMVRLLKQAGCFQVFVGLESGSDRLLRTMGKPYTAEQAAHFLRMLRQTDLYAEISLITDYPGETETDFFDTLQFIQTHRHAIPKIAQINPFIALPGTEYYTSPSPPPRYDPLKISRLTELARSCAIPYTSHYIQNLIR
ncbi:MAG: B12-binding domain-containing radical SAM protein [Candidatus Delongbacteria bacterium]|nr:B12-binding domain-containing radical SAM protein [Candidatus Delongbacteria bacterium]